MSNKAIFLDRDGIVNREIGHYILSVDEFELLPSIIPFMIKGAEMGYRFVLITNQGGIARGLYSHELVNRCHNKLAAALQPQGLSFDEMYYCPHFPTNGACICRKPDSQMIEKALARFGFDREKCLMIGDKERDVAAANKAGVTGHLLPSNPSTDQLLACLPR